MNIVIIEDEVHTAWDIQNCIKTLRPGHQILAVLDSIESSVEWFLHNPHPQLVISDIQLGDGLAFEIFQKVGLTCPVIFCTAYDEYAIQAFQSNGIDYILKPINENLFEASLEKLESIAQLFAPKHNWEMIKMLLSSFQSEAHKYKTSFLIHFRNQLIPVATENILLFKVNHDTTEIFVRDGRKFQVYKPLDTIEAQVDPHRFYRANRQTLLAFEAIHRIEHYDERKLLVRLDGVVTEPVIVSKAKSASFLAWVENR
ncbi:LytR/AlgR family response regulator transcription factor [Dyadobacter sp. MSC1_007]|jgi:DNA-binding LytR/AlgR family response regulator|uniref:LytR/AlgR family response regulator transcription factor n=1 Tax=Dyadobacter sp. MSC1_007 TaxID=2909264 RepID=UPI00202E74C3|nr:LytTR family DNA-binding domain-containing protein [Dyadobacter sp. MSC1_007]